jgi:phage/plasmid-like protein (TIGR03299 family)
MTAQVETLAYTNAAPFSGGLGVSVDNKMSPEEMLTAAKIDWTVSKRKIFFMDKANHSQEVKDRMCLVRDSDERPLTITGTTWKPVQNIEAVSFFKKFVATGHMSMEHMGSLVGGKYIWALANINRAFTLGKDDEVKGYLLLMQPHQQGKAMVIQSLDRRTWCWNTLTRKLTAKGEGAFRMSHSIAFDEGTKERAELALKLAVRNFDELKQQATLLSKKKVTEKQVENYFFDVLKFDPKEAVKQEKEEPRMLAHLRTALLEAPGQQLPSALGTLWGAVNAVTYVIDHETGRDRGASLRSAWFGTKANLKSRALELALARAK